MSREGMIEQVAEGKYRLSASEREILEGVVDMTSSGALYVVVEGQDKDIYVDEAHAGHALHGDRVKVAIVRKGGTGNPEGEVVEIVERSPTRYVGVVELSDNFAFVRIDNRKMAHDVFVPERNLHGAKQGQKVLVRITGWPETMKSPEGEIVDVFGTPGDNNTEMHAILAEYDLPYTYPEEVEREADKIPEELAKIPAEQKARYDAMAKAEDYDGLIAELQGFRYNGNPNFDYDADRYYILQAVVKVNGKGLISFRTLDIAQTIKATTDKVKSWAYKEAEKVERSILNSGRAL